MSITANLVRLFKPLVERLPFVALTYRQIRDNTQTLGKPKLTPFGFKLVGYSVMQEGNFEPNETAIIRKILGSVDIVVNVGANIGYYCCMALQAGKQVIAFEPLPSNLRYLYRNVLINGWQENIEVYPIALSNRVGMIEIFGGGTGASLVKGWAGTPEQYVEVVPMSTLDNVLGTRIENKAKFFLVDIEGAEKWMLEGALLSLEAKVKPIWMVEVSISEHQPKGISINPELLATFDIFWDAGYEAWTADKQQRPVLRKELEAIVQTGKDTLHTHNFLFIEKGRKADFFDA